MKWASEVKRIDTEALNKPEELRLFADFMENYNTGRVLTLA